MFATECYCSSCMSDRNFKDKGLQLSLQPIFSKSNNLDIMNKITNPHPQTQITEI